MTPYTRGKGVETQKGNSAQIQLMFNSDSADVTADLTAQIQLMLQQIQLRFMLMLQQIHDVAADLHPTQVASCCFLHYSTRHHVNVCNVSKQY